MQETTTTTGTGTVDLAGAVSGFQGFVAGVGNGAKVVYCIEHQSADEWEVGEGTVTDAAPDTLSRTTVLSSSNGDTLVAFSAGTKDVRLVHGAKGAIGYAVGQGGTVTQLVSKTTTVTLNKICGQITTHNSALGSGVATGFQVNNSLVEAGDTILIHRASGGTSGLSYVIWCIATGNGAFAVGIYNITAGSLSEALVLNFSVIKATSA